MESQQSYAGNGGKLHDGWCCHWCYHSFFFGWWYWQKKEYFDRCGSLFGTVINGIVFVLSTFIAIGMVDKGGRKPALKIGFGVMAASMAVVGVCMGLLEAGNAPVFVPYLAAIMTMVSIAGFGMSAGPIVWVLCSEIQPLKSREFGIACSTMTNWITCAIVGATFLTLVDTLGSSMTFWLYAALNGFFIVLTISFVPETKNVSLEKIEQNLMKGKKLREIGC